MRSRSERGQGMVEFALVLPLLLIFVLGVADFGRVFADGIALEAAVRNSAEAGAQEYLQLCNQYSTGCAGMTQNDYDTLHARAIAAGCLESERLTNRQVASGTCTNNPVMTNPRIAVCVHDNSLTPDTQCGVEGSAPGVPPGCTWLNGAIDHPWNPAQSTSTDRPYVEVRMCYIFEPLIPLTKVWWGSVLLQKHNDFAVTNYS